jgi:TraB/PrgY/gumN family
VIVGLPLAQEGAYLKNARVTHATNIYVEPTGRSLGSIAQLFVFLALYMSVFSAPVTHAATLPHQPGMLDEQLVTGERPGPAMWRVSNGDHDLWILATLSPLPKHMTWRSHAVENRIAQSQVVLAPPEILADVSFFGNPAYAAYLDRAQQIPHRGSLDQLCSAYRSCIAKSGKQSPACTING